MRCNKKVLMIATTVMMGVGCIGLMGAMKYQNVKTEASNIKESEVAKPVLMLPVLLWRGRLRMRLKGRWIRRL